MFDLKGTKTGWDVWWNAKKVGHVKRVRGGWKAKTVSGMAAYNDANGTYTFRLRRDALKALRP